MNGLYEELTLALHAVWRRRWLALGVAWGVAALGWLVISLIPNKYESEARILVAAQSLLPDKVGITSNDRQAGLDTVRQTLTAQTNLERVVRGTDLSQQVANDADVAARASAMSKTIKIVAEQDNLFKITASSGDSGLSDAANARISRQIVQKLIDLFVDGNLSGTRVETGQTLRFLDAQLSARAAQLGDAQAKRAAFEAKYMSGLPGGGTIDERIDAARSEIARIDMDLSTAQASLAAANGQLGSTPATIHTPGVMVGGAPSATAGLQAQIAEGRARGWTDQHPDMVAMRSQLSRMGGGGGSAPHMSAGSSMANPVYSSIRSLQAEKAALVSSLAGRKAQLQSQINGVVAAQTGNPEVAAEQTQLDRNYTVLKTQYDKLLADREDVKLRGQVQTQTDAVKISVIDPPSAPRVPAAPNRPLLLTIVLLAALAGGAGAAFAMGRLRTTYATASRLARASGLPVIGSIGAVVRDEERDARRAQMKRFAGAGAALAGVYALLMIVEFVQRGMVA